MMLSDRTLLKLVDDGRLVVTPFDRALVQPASIDLRLGEVDTESLGARASALATDTWFLPPGQVCLASTWETVCLPADLYAVCDGKSTWGRRFLAVHVTAGFIDPGFAGQVTLELVNLHPSRAVNLRRGDRIAQLRVGMLDRPAMRPYGHPDLGSHYQGQTGPTPAAAS